MFCRCREEVTGVSREVRSRLADHDSKPEHVDTCSHKHTTRYANNVNSLARLSDWALYCILCRLSQRYPQRFWTRELPFETNRRSVPLVPAVAWCEDFWLGMDARVTRRVRDTRAAPLQVMDLRRQKCSTRMTCHSPILVSICAWCIHCSVPWHGAPKF